MSFITLSFCHIYQRHQAELGTKDVKKFRNALSRLRISSHRLEVETGRWNKPQRIEYVERKCRLCNKLEDEFHFFNAVLMKILEAHISLGISE